MNTETALPPLNDFADLLQAACHQPEPQRLLLVFTAAELPADADAVTRQRFADGAGGALVPVLCVDKLPESIADMAALRAESAHTGTRWDVLFVAALDGRGGHPPNPDEAERPLRLMVQAIRSGRIAHFLAFDRDGELLSLMPA